MEIRYHLTTNNIVGDNYPVTHISMSRYDLEELLSASNQEIIKIGTPTNLQIFCFDPRVVKNKKIARDLILESLIYAPNPEPGITREGRERECDD